ncbi:MAG: YqcC family protein [Pseudomonadales bacterium]
MAIDITQQTSFEQLADILLELEAALRERQLWEAKPPSLVALSSQQPFCFDTLRFTQWLQFVFIERLKAIIECCAALPARSGIVPIAEENFKGVTYDARRIIYVLAQFDAFIEQQFLYK